MKDRGVAQGVGGLTVFFAGWELAVRSGLASYDYLPAPSTVFAALVHLAAGSTFWGEIRHTLLAALLGWLIAAVAGVAGGLALGLVPGLRRYCLASVEVLRPLPAVAFVPVGLVLFGFSLQMELAVIVLPALWPVLVNTMGGINAIAPRLGEVARSFRIGRLDATLRIYVPAAAAAVLVGLRLSLSLAVVMAVIAEMVGNPQGLGYAVVREQQALHPAEMFAYVLVIGCIGVLLNQALLAAARVALPGEFRRPVALSGGAR
jgi:ABC-type nitrate/sulfonate/bicarbonate transport system permease component